MVDEKQGKVFLVTNKHVINSDHTQRPHTPYIVCHFNTRDAAGAPGTLQLNVPLRDAAGNPRFQEHPDRDTDVYAINVTDIIIQHPNIEKKWVGYELFGDAAKRKELEITAGEEVVTIGYPLGLRQGDSNYPLIRQGVISTTIGTILKDQVQDGKGGMRSRNLRAFLVDGATVPGSSGSPVVLKPVIGRHVGTNIEMGTAPPVLLGIVAETRYAPIKVGGGVIPGFAGLGLVFEVETIRETIELFFP